MQIFFSIFLCFYFLTSFSQKDSLSNKFTIGISPLLFIAPNQDGLYLEYQSNDILSFEVGGGIYNLIKMPFAVLDASGFTIRFAIISKRKSKISSLYEVGKPSSPKGIKYFKPLFFYRQMNFKDRGYSGSAGPIYETSTVFHNNFSYEALGLNKIADEIKYELCAELLWGNKYFILQNEHWIFDYYYGFGLRMKYRILNIKQENLAVSGATHIVDPPKKETIISILPSLHLGFKIGYSF